MQSTADAPSRRRPRTVVTSWWTVAYDSTAISDGSTTIASSVLQSLRDINNGVLAGDTIFWDGDQWVCSAPDSEISHSDIADLGNDDHLQYALLAGRAGGQTLKGDTASGGNLTLESTSHATKGDVIVIGDLRPSADATYDLGINGTAWRDIYMNGQAKGMRLENFTTAGRPPAVPGSSRSPNRQARRCGSRLRSIQCAARHRSPAEPAPPVPRS